MSVANIIILYTCFLVKDIVDYITTFHFFGGHIFFWHLSWLYFLYLSISYSYASTICHILFLIFQPCFTLRNYRNKPTFYLLKSAKGTTLLNPLYHKVINKARTNYGSTDFIFLLYFPWPEYHHFYEEICIWT